MDGAVDERGGRGSQEHPTGAQANNKFRIVSGQLALSAPWTTVAHLPPLDSTPRPSTRRVILLTDTRATRKFGWAFAVMKHGKNICRLLFVNSKVANFRDDREVLL